MELMIKDSTDSERPDLLETDYTSGIVPTTDDPTIPAFTFRVVVLGGFWSITLGACNAILSFRTNPFSVDSLLASLLSYPLGNFLSRVLTDRIWFRGKMYSFTLNPGPFSMKEHVLLSVMASSGAAGAYGIDNVVVQKHWLFIGNESIRFFESLAFVLILQFIGFGIAGIARRYLVSPKAMLWPGILASVAMYVTLHEAHVPSGKWIMSRFTFFWICSAFIFVYSWIPGYFFTILQSLSILCFITPFTSFVRFLASSDYSNGVGLFSLTFDFAYISTSAFTTPFIYYCNFMAGNLLYAWIAVPLLYMWNPFNRPVFQSEFYKGTNITRPIINSVGLFSNNGSSIPAKKLYNSTTFDLNLPIYNELKPIFLTDFFALTYFANFATLAAMFSHVGLWYGRRLLTQTLQAFKQVNNSEQDIHNQLMKNYKQIKESWYLMYLLICIILMILVTEFTAFSLPFWAVILAIFLSWLVLIPIGLIEAVTGTRIYVNVLSQLVIGFILPGKTIAVMTFKSLLTNTVGQALVLVSDLKLGHYLKISPRSMVSCQLAGTFLGAIATTLTSWLIMNGMTLLGTQDWRAINYMTFYNAGAIWGAVGPARFFGSESPYSSLMYGFLIGFILPWIPWLLDKLFPSKKWAFINFPLILYISHAGQIQNYILIPCIVNFIFQFLIFKYQNEWWKRYNYVLAASVSGSVALATLIITLLRNLNVSAPVWFGNPVNSTLDFYCF